MRPTPSQALEYGTQDTSCPTFDRTFLPQQPNQAPSTEVLGMSIKRSRKRGSIVRKLIKIAVLAAALGGRTAIAETNGADTFSRSTIASAVKDPRLNTPIGHRQPRVQDLPSGLSGEFEHISEEDRAADRRLIICRGC